MKSLGAFLLGFVLCCGGAGLAAAGMLVPSAPLFIGAALLFWRAEELRGQ